MIGAGVIGAGVIGFGYWGPNLARNLAAADGCRVQVICDASPERLSVAARLHPGAKLTNQWEDLIRSPDVDLIAVATPVATHFPMTLAALRAGKHVLVEKPLAATAGEAAALIEEAARQRVVLMVDHTFIFTGAVRKIRELARNGDLGEICYYDSVRMNLGLYHDDVNVMWDLAVHDLSIVDHVLSQKPCAVAATGMRHVPATVENIAYLTVFFESSLIAHTSVSWLAPVKVRRTLIGGDKKMILYDDLEPSEKVKVYDNGVTVDNHITAENVHGIRFGYRTGDMWAPKLDLTEGLRTATAHFLECVRTGARPIADGESGWRIVRILEAATQSLQQRGRPVELEGGW